MLVVDMDTAIFLLQLAVPELLKLCGDATC